MFIFLVDIDGDHNYLRYKVRSYVPPGVLKLKRLLRALDPLLAAVVLGFALFASNVWPNIEP